MAFVQPTARSKKEELANALSHGVGMIGSLAALILLVRDSLSYGMGVHVWCFSLYGATMLMVYTSSTLLHGFPVWKWNKQMEKLDHASIYLFIAGTYTPILGLIVKGTLGTVLLAAVWGAVLLGIILQSVYLEKYMHLFTTSYVVLGLMIVLVWDVLASTLPGEAVTLLLTGIAVYLFGFLFYLWRTFPYHHAVWHFFVLIGSAVHFLVMYRYVLPLSLT
jgi:hemolysin III